MTCIGTREHIGGNLEHIGHIFGKIVLAPCIGLRVTLGTCIGANTSQKTPIRGIFVTSVTFYPNSPSNEETHRNESTRFCFQDPQYRFCHEYTYQRRYYLPIRRLYFNGFRVC